MLISISDEQDEQTSLSTARGGSNKKQRARSYQASSSVTTSSSTSDLMSQRGRSTGSSRPTQSSRFRAILPAPRRQSLSPGISNGPSYAEIRANRMYLSIIAFRTSV